MNGENLRSTRNRDGVSIDVIVEIWIDRLREDVARVSMDPANDTAWIGGISEARVVTGGSFGVGSRLARVASFLGKRIEYVSEIDELEPGRRLEMHSVAGPLPMRITYGFADGGEGGSAARVRVEGDAGGFYAVASPLLRAQGRRSVTGDLRRLKRLLEQRQLWGALTATTTRSRSSWIPRRSSDRAL